MSKIKLATVFIALTTTLAVHSQTLGELAELQRQKIEGDSKPKADATPLKALPTKKQTPAPQPLYSVHSIYTKKGKLIAEITDGNTLVVAQPGLWIGKSRVVEITDTGIIVSEAKGPAKSVPVGGRF